MPGAGRGTERDQQRDPRHDRAAAAGRCGGRLPCRHGGRAAARPRVRGDVSRGPIGRDGRSDRGRGRFDRRRARCRCGRRLVAAMGPGQCRRSRRRGGSHRRADHRVERPLDAARGGERAGGHLADCGFRDRPGQHRSWRVGRRHRRRRIYGSGLVRSIRNRQFRSRGDRHRNQRPGHDLKPRRIHWRRRAAGDRAGRHGRRVLRYPGHRIPRSWRFGWRRLRRRLGRLGGGSAGGGAQAAAPQAAVGRPRALRSPRRHR